MDTLEYGVYVLVVDGDPVPGSPLVFSSTSSGCAGRMLMPLKTIALALRAATWMPLARDDGADPLGVTSSSPAGLIAISPPHFPFFFAVFSTSDRSFDGIGLASRSRTGFPSAPASQKKKCSALPRVAFILANAA